MDPHIARMNATPDGDLMLIRSAGIAYQADMQAGRIEYDDVYWQKVSAYEGSEIAARVIAGRIAMLKRHAIAGRSVLDIGAGTGAFVVAARQAEFYARGFDLMPMAVQALKRAGLYAVNVAAFDVVALWDSIEHMENPQNVLAEIELGTVLLVSVPIFPGIGVIRQSKHYRPGEHLYYFTERGFIDWMRSHGFRVLERSGHEIDAGRESIGAFAFVRDALP